MIRVGSTLGDHHFSRGGKRGKVDSSTLARVTRGERFAPEINAETESNSHSS